MTEQTFSAELRVRALTEARDMLVRILTDEQPEPPPADGVLEHELLVELVAALAAFAAVLAGGAGSGPAAELAIETVYRGLALATLEHDG